MTDPRATARQWLAEVLVDDRCPPDTIFVIGQPKDASEEPDPDMRWHGRAAVIRVPAEEGKTA
jgi:hypothetical protein